MITSGATFDAETDTRFSDRLTRASSIPGTLFKSRSILPIQPAQWTVGTEKFRLGSVFNCATSLTDGSVAHPEQAAIAVIL